MNALKKANIEIDRRVLADLAVHDKPAFSAIVDQAKASLVTNGDTWFSVTISRTFYRVFAVADI